VTVPLIAGGDVLGGLTLVTTGSRRLTADDLVLLEDLAGRAAITLANARLFDERSRVARTLQQSLLPPALPRIPGLDLAARYRPASSSIDIGGDFYDLFECTDGAWAVAIGDVCGKGTAAAALTGLFRHTLRAAAVGESSPSRVLALTNDVILDQIDEAAFCTAALVRAEVEPGVRTAVTVSCGGHPEPLVLRTDAEVETVMCRGTLLGVFPDPPLVDEKLVLSPGDALVLYTDGVTEARRDGEIFGEERLADVLRNHPGASPAAIADAIEQAVTEWQGGAGSDDIALIVIQPTS
jgi:serine phosphatase RsbU (regulator of sigma subunit)